MNNIFNIKFSNSEIRRKIKQFIINIFLRISRRYREKHLKRWYYRKTNHKLNLIKPQTYGEKIQWLKLNDSTLLKSELADKYAVRNWIKNKIGTDYLIPLIGYWKKFDDINFDNLPNQFVLKCNHGSGYNIAVKDKSQFDYDEAKKQFDIWMKEDYGFRQGLELHYSRIKRKIIAEEYIDSSLSEVELQAYCFNGKVKFISYLTDKSQEKRYKCLFTPNWQVAEFKMGVEKFLDFEIVPPKPKCLEEFLEISEKLAQGFYHVRVDFIIYNGKLKFREMTFTPSNGTSRFEPEDAAFEIGKMMILPCDL